MKVRVKIKLCNDLEILGKGYASKDPTYFGVIMSKHAICFFIYLGVIVSKQETCSFIYLGVIMTKHANCFFILKLGQGNLVGLIF